MTDPAASQMAVIVPWDLDAVTKTVLAWHGNRLATGPR